MSWPTESNLQHIESAGVTAPQTAGMAADLELLADLSIRRHDLLRSLAEEIVQSFI